MYTKAKVDSSIACDFSNNLIFCNENILSDIINDEFLEERVRANCLSELLIREYFSRDKSLREIISKVLINNEVSSFLSAMPQSYFYPHEDERLNLWEGKTSLSRSCLVALRSRLEKLFITDGIIPVEYKGQGFLIPFHLEIAETKSEVVDLAGEVIPSWSQEVERLNLPIRVCVQCYTKQVQGEFSGGSLMLPVWVAFLMKNGEIPKFNPFSLIFSGAFDHRSVLTPVQIKGKMQAILKNFPKSKFVVPEDGGIGDEPLKNVVFLPLLCQEEVYKIIRKKVEELDYTSLQYALERLPTISDEVRYFQSSDWEELVKRLENNAVFDEDDHPDEYLINLMLQSEANCHAGHTDKALEINSRALEYAKKFGDRFLKKVLRLQINKLVLLLDEEKFSEINCVTPLVGEDVDNCNDLDLQMRFHGTMGQIHAYGTLSNVLGCNKDTSLMHFEKAKDIAFKLGALADKRQDINYLHLWHALFLPGTQKESDAYQRAVRMAAPHDGETQNSENRVRNICYILRQRFLGWYRHWLLNGCVLNDELPRDADKLLSNSKNTWLRATSCKYLGALAVARGNNEEAKEYFSRALEPIEGEENSSIILFIKMTIYAEAYRSMISLGDEVKAMEFLEKAKQLVEKNKEEFKTYSSFKFWRDYLENPETTEFPGLKYWY